MNPSKSTMDRKQRRVRDQQLCPNCGTEYWFYTKEAPNVIGPKCPLVLQCGHSMCAGCVTYRAGKSTNNKVKCGICSTESEADFKKVQERFPINAFVVGQLFIKKLGTQKMDDMIGFYQHSKKRAPLKDSVLCDECNQASSECVCRQCNTRLCNKCFDKMHSSGLTLRRHEKVPIDKAVVIACKEALCKEHPDKICEYFCENCQKYICDICLRKDHLKHSCVDVSEKNKEIMEEFTEAYDEANEVLKLLYATQKKLERVKPMVQLKEVSSIEKQVAVHFIQLHGVLQLIEDGIMKQMAAVKNGTHDASSDMLNKVETDIQEMEALLAQGKASLDESGCSSFPLYGMLEKLKNISAMPCMLVETDAQAPAKLEFSADPAIIKQLKDHCNLVVPSAKSYEIRCKPDLKGEVPVSKPPSTAISQDPIADKIQFLEKALTNTSIDNKLPILPQTEVKTKKPTSYQEMLKKHKLQLERQNKSVDVISVASSDGDIERISSVPPLTIGTTEIVTLCHLVSPSNFYVQRKCAQSLLEKVMQHFSKQANIKKQPPENVLLERMYLVCFDIDKKWYRGVVKKILENNMYEVFYVDYGNTESVNITKLRDISQHYANFPGQAISCCLHSCFPVDGKWNEDAIKLMVEMTDGVEFSMYIEEINPVSLFVPSIHQVHLRSVDDRILSVADVLVFLGYAHLSEDEATEDIMFKVLFTSSNKNIKSYFKDVSINKGESFDAQITHVNSPSNFYIRKLSDGGQQLISLMMDLKQTYSSLGPDEQLILSPIPGLPVAAKFKDGEWYRGVVLEVVKVCQVRVQYIDFGNIECVKWKDIRTLHPKFLRMSMQGVKCALSDITPKHPKGWSVPAKKAFENMAEKDTLFRVFVDSIEQNQLNVIVYNLQVDEDICFNGLMVQNGHANSVGPSSMKAVIKHGGDKSSVKIPASPGSSVSKSNSQSRKTVKTFSLPTEDFQDLNIDCLGTPAEGLVSDEEASRLKVKVLKVVSPGELYITFEEISRKIMAQSVEMTSFYKSRDVEDRTWAMGDLCAVLRQTDKKWHRGLIQSISSNMYKVFIKDILDIVEVDISALRSLDPKFMRLMDGSVKCHLSGILPPGGMSYWPHTAIEHLKALSTDTSAEYFINQMGDLVNDSLPVQCWRKIYVTGGALDPIVESWMDLSEELLDRGYGLPDKTSKHYELMKRKRACNESSDDNTTNANVMAWLHDKYTQSSSKSHFFSELEQEIAAEKLAGPRTVGENPRNEITSWKPAIPLKSLDLVAYPSYVDYDCAIYVQTEENVQTLDLIRSSLNAVFYGSVAKPPDLTWFNGEICIVFYKQDTLWYRGQVKKVLPEHIEVLFVDYGNVEFVQPEDLRKQIVVGTIPIQCHRCLVEGVTPVSPDNKWPIKTLDFIHATIVTKKCRVILKPPSHETGLYTVINLVVPCGQNLIELLASMNFVSFTIDCDKLCIENEHSNNEIPDNLSEESTPIVPETQNLPVIDWYNIVLPEEVSQDAPAYKELILPDSVVELPVEVTTVSSTNCTSLSVTIHSCEDPEVISLIGEFDLMHEQMQEQAESMPAIVTPYIGLPCVGCYSEDNIWYRAVIKEIDIKEQRVTVLYVDYGNLEKLSIHQLKTIKKEWLKIPIMCLRVELHNVCKGPNYDKASVDNLMEGCLKTPPYTMSIVTRQPSFQVDLFNSDGELAYERLINLGLLAKITDIL